MLTQLRGFIHFDEVAGVWRGEFGIIRDGAGELLDGEPLDIRCTRDRDRVGSHGDVEPEEQLGLVRNFDREAFSKECDVGVSLGSSVVGDPRIINIDAGIYSTIRLIAQRAIPSMVLVVKNSLQVPMVCSLG